MQHRAVDRETVRLGAEYADHLIFAVRRLVPRAEHIHPVVDGVTVIRRDVQIPVAVDLVDLGRPELLGIGHIRFRAEHAFARAGEVMDVVRAADLDPGVVDAVNVVIIALPCGNKGVCPLFDDRIVKGLCHESLRCLMFFFYFSTSGK